MLAERGIPVEVCLTSNVATGAIRRIEDHPLRRFLEHAVPVTLSSDDPAMFATSIEREMILAAQYFGLSGAEMLNLARNSINAAFLPGHTRDGLRNKLLRGAGAAAERMNVTA
jgi:aminodeoxyfutalosine deaminase